MKIGLIGLGRMGSAIAQRLADKNFKVIAFDRDPERCNAVKSTSIQIAKDPKTVAECCDIVVSIITDDRAVQALFLDRDGLLQTNVSGKLFIEMSTIQPMTVQKLGQTVEERGAGLVDAPVLGSVPAAREGKLLALVGGHEPHLDRSQAVLGTLTRRIAYLGPNGSGSAMKLAINLTMAAYLQSLAEALAIGQRYDLTLDVMLEILSEAPTANPWLTSKLNLLRGGRSDITLDIRTLRKDIMCAVATGALAGVPMPAAGGILASLSAAVAGGWGARDLGELPRFFREFMLQTAPASEV